MFLPIVAYGSSILREKCVEITSDYPELDILLDNMWNTMNESNGVGLAAPQINKSIRIFLIDTTPLMEKGNEDAYYTLAIENLIKQGKTVHFVETGGLPWMDIDTKKELEDVRKINKEFGDW